MPPFVNRNNCSQEPAKYVPAKTEVKVCDIPDNFPNSCKKMIGKTYPASVHVDRSGKTWYNILKEFVFGEDQELGFAMESIFQHKDSEKVSFKNRKHIKLQAKYCN